MATSQNGWRASTTSATMVPLSWITGRVHPAALAMFDYLCRRFNAEVEPIIRARSWGWAYRPIRGRTTLSNHASGTAIDLNAPAHPLGRRNTFTRAQQAAIWTILGDLQHIVVWGGPWTRPDDMHFEVASGVTPARINAVMASLTAGIGSKPDSPAPESEEDDMSPEQYDRLIKDMRYLVDTAVRDVVRQEVFEREVGGVPRLVSVIWGYRGTLARDAWQMLVDTWNAARKPKA